VWPGGVEGSGGGSGPPGATGPTRPVSGPAHGGTRADGGTPADPRSLFGLNRDTAQPVLTWALTTTFGILLFALLLRSGWMRVDVPSGLSVLVMDGRRGSGRGGTVTLSGGTSHGSARTAGVDGAESSDASVAGWDTTRPSGRFVGVGRAPLLFDRPAAAGVDRQTVAYRYVRVSAGPDDLRFPELARLDRRDEVEVLGSEAGFLQVRTPDGIVGWVPRIVLVGSPVQPDH
jgi:hypothetical protein